MITSMPYCSDMGKNSKQFIEVFELTADSSREGRMLYLARVGNVYMSQYVIEPGITVRGHYHKEARNIFYVEEGKVRCRFENVNTRELRSFEVRPGKDVIHIPEYVAHEFRNVGPAAATLVIFCNNQPRSGDDWDYAFTA